MYMKIYSNKLKRSKDLSLVITKWPICTGFFYCFLKVLCVGVEINWFPSILDISHETLSFYTGKV